MADLYREGFDTATKIKLHILKEYIKEWLPVFLKKNRYWNDVFVYDFFAGEGYDDNGNPGSPIIMLDELKNYQDIIIQEKINLNVCFNDIIEEKIKKLEEKVGNDLPFNIRYKNSDFTKLFNEIYPKMVKGNNGRLPRFMFLDQYGIKYVTPAVFEKLTTLDRTDFIFFISSSFLQRFAEQEEFQRYLKINKKEFDDKKPYQCHRVIFEYYQSLLPSKEYYLAPFSLKKDKGNVYGLIFGSNNALGIEKFMNICWKMDGRTGEANFNIDDDLVEGSTLDLFDPDPRPKKLKSFERYLEKLIEDNEITNLLDLYRNTYNFGCLPKHANSLLKELAKKGRVKKDLPLATRNIHRLNNNILLK